MNTMYSKKFQTLGIFSFTFSLFLVLARGGDFLSCVGAVSATTFVLFNLFLWCERVRLSRDFDAVAGGIFSHTAVISMFAFTIIPVIVFTAFVPTHSVPLFGRNLFWMFYLALGVWLWAWNFSTKLITPKAGMVAVGENGQRYEAGKIIDAPLFPLAPLRLSIEGRVS